MVELRKPRWRVYFRQSLDGRYVLCQPVVSYGLRLGSVPMPIVIRQPDKPEPPCPTFSTR